jgi:hypothetical protein
VLTYAVPASSTMAAEMALGRPCDEAGVEEGVKKASGSRASSISRSSCFVVLATPAVYLSRRVSISIEVAKTHDQVTS